ncbi:7-cyano-7-deazaguanine synthase QueC [bacterium]|mgnify:FL=1|jgi:7-cyano-7-deazaguanine synthase|nr:7-cyano-7-deazaguanine synthase QueC [Verrucomicrobiales bacterium]MDC0312608.1 7-cyano-7-deazaguanine synthase QueC [Verrucomicrobiales bacterium]MDC0503708.1 7-cyano-7-deazaguanine synthase QueC [Verrucomicrobiales bacterium]MDC3254987.1 7-cyano-7-deazaguanine synthase QueC [bacterium]MDF1785185.1 7-cyano-7-deazaguanine synthase QueC [Verrucomicrobiales bacterium]
MKVLVLVSGGMDSVVALHEAEAEHEVVAGLSFDYGAKHNHREIPFAKKHCDSFGIRHEVIDLRFMNTHFESALLRSGEAVPDGHYEESIMKQTVVPFRNGIMLSVAAGLAESRGAEGLVIAAHSGDHAIYPDCRESFMKAMGDAIQLGTYAEMNLLRPFINLRKEDIAVRGEVLGIDFSQTWSCYKGGEKHCGSCGTCVERKEAFALAGMADPTQYD